MCCKKGDKEDEEIKVWVVDLRLHQEGIASTFDHEHKCVTFMISDNNSLLNRTAPILCQVNVHVSDIIM